ncbi:hypothetical protein [Actinomycetospora sp. NBRC 106378]|uniref:hypothetical protein n=1 Tax=Actinomycetospora sp. NBRC 106378 TaxID=3032208 RepID=UPI0024A3B9B8|nr:hypothetical protein [Actinomycetospora sp. NBRC 106378]GLZ53963.1 hypothetical protein Acsp07_35800 [Actinomycetospora sp. NBRC 106378]
MSLRKPLAALGLAGATLPLLAGVAQADESQSPLQAVTAVSAIGSDLLAQSQDASNVDGNRPQGADGTETKVPDADYRYAEGPAGGLVKDGPFE